MRVKLLRISVSFGAVLSAYLVYALVAVRLIEPSVSAAPTSTRTVKDYKAARDLSNQAALALRPYFPEGAWELRKDVKLLGNDRVKLLISDYKSLPDGVMKLDQCTMMFFEEPNPNKEKAQPIILQAPEGALLKFDEDFDYRRGKIGKLIGGQLDGKVTIRRQPSHPGAADDLLIETKNLVLAEDRVVTPEAVNFRFGGSYGSGRELTILLTRQDPVGKQSKTPQISGVRSLTLTREVTVHMVMMSDDAPSGDVFPAGPAAFGQQPQLPPAPAPKAQQPPVKITCQGPFCFDLEHSVATFNEKVDVFRLNASGPSDEMNCELLAIHFVEREDPTKPAAKQPQTKRPANLANLEARWIEARGDPVIIRAPSQGAQVRGQRVEYDLKTGRIVVDGPGTLQGASPRNPSGLYAAQWSHQLRVEPLVGEQLVIVQGGAMVKLTDLGPRAADGSPQTGTLWADEIRAWLITTPTSAVTAAQPAAPAAGPARHETIQTVAVRTPGAAPPPGPRDETRPKRVLAQGAVRVESPQLIGATGQLDAIFVLTPPLAAGAAAGANQTGPGSPAASQSPGNRGRTTRSEQQFRVAGSKMEIHLAVRGQATAVSELFLDGKALLVEAKTAKPEDKPLVVSGDRLEVFKADLPDTKIVVIGKPGKVEARGLSLAGPEIDLERASNLLWIDGPGRMVGPAPGDGSLAAAGAPGKAPPRALPPGAAPPAGADNLDITWTGRMRFDGHTAHFERGVVAHTATWQARTETLDATLQRTIDFAHPPDPNSKAEPATLEQLVCAGGPRGRVEFESRSNDESGQLESIDRMEAPDLALNRTTGGIDAHGPGWVSSVRRGMAAAASSRGLAGTPPAGPQAKPVAARKPTGTGGSDPNALTYLTVHFARSISGNMYKRELTFANQVKCIYGPVPTWETVLDVENPDQAGPDAINLTTDALTVREAPGRLTGERSWLELETQGNTQADGMGITARAHRLTFAEQKSLMVLEGDGTSNASVFRQTTPGGPVSTTTASRILFWPNTSRVEVDNGRFIDLGPMPGSPARRDDNKTT
ncbi:MAG TPA: hypothetical protein VMF30_00270, partial [Pirellulales bacterium]|nr:hypothetical protein [Pirellulales bacterium]